MYLRWGPGCLTRRLPLGAGKPVAPGGVFTIAQLENYTDLKLIGTLGMANTIQHDSHLGAAEFHQLAVQERRDDAGTTSEEDHLTRHEHQKRTMEQAIRALEQSPEAHRKSQQQPMEKPQMSKAPGQVSSDA
jgi:hypothetical protein